jgi:hypothetical protein
MNTPDKKLVCSPRQSKSNWGRLTIVDGVGPKALHCRKYLAYNTHILELQALKSHDCSARSFYLSFERKRVIVTINTIYRITCGCSERSI